jgi:hypothetical protein
MSRFTDGLLRKLAGRRKPKNKPKRRKLTIERLREVVSYDATTGEFRWLVRISHRVQAGDIAGALNGPGGHTRIGIDNVELSASRLAIYWVTGRYPAEHQVTHIDGNPGNLAWENLTKPPKPPRRRVTSRYRAPLPGSNNVTEADNA